MEKRYLRRNLPSSLLFQKIADAERRMEAGEREMGFYLLDLKSRRLHRDAKCASFHDFVLTRTGITPKKAAELVRVALALESLPSMDAAFARGEIYWSAVRAMSAVATPQTEEKWVDFAKSHRVNEVESRVVSSKPGEEPEDHRFKRRPQRYPYRLNVTAEKHQAFDMLTAMLSKVKGTEVSLDEALAEAAGLLISKLIEEDAGRGRDRIFPSSIRRVIFFCPGCKEHAVATSSGRVWIDEETAKKLIEGAEVLNLTSDSEAETPTEETSKCPIWDNVKTEVVENSQPHKKPAMVEISSEVVQHASNLSTPDRPMVPPEKRDIPNTPEITKRVLSRDGYYCRVQGCTNLAEQSHHLEWRSQGGRTVVKCQAGFCIPHHDMFHKGQLLVSGTGDDLRISDPNLRPIVSTPSPSTTAVELVVESKPPSETTCIAETATPTVTVIPQVMERSFWLAHRHQFEWSERRKALVYHPEWSGEAAIETETNVAGSSNPHSGGQPGLDSFKGQPRAVRNLGIALHAALDREEMPPPILFSGPPGLGKTTLAKLIAGELGARLHQVQGPALLDLGALVGVLAGIEKGAVLFIDEIHRVPAAILECLYQALDEGAMSLPVINGPAGANVRFVNLRIEPFLLIGATTEESLLPKPLRSRFTLKERLDLYPKDELETLAISAGSKLGVEVTQEGARALAGGARGTPRILLGHLGRARDLAQVERQGPNNTAITGDVALRSLEFQGIDPSGLSPIERKLLEVLLTRGRPLGLRTLSDLIGESPRTLLEVHEPYLVHEGYLARTLRGRVATAKARSALGA